MNDLGVIELLFLHPPYGPEIASSDYHLFHFHGTLCERKFNKFTEVETGLQDGSLLSFSKLRMVRYEGNKSNLSESFFSCTG